MLYSILKSRIREKADRFKESTDKFEHENVTKTIKCNISLFFSVWFYLNGSRLYMYVLMACHVLVMLILVDSIVQRNE